MNSQFPESHEDRLLDELLQEQHRGPDAAFVQQIEIAVNTSSVATAKRPANKNAARNAIAASILLAAEVGVFWRHQMHLSEKHNLRMAAVVARENAAVRLEELNEIIDPQDGKDEEALLANNRVQVQMSMVEPPSAPSGSMSKVITSYGVAPSSIPLPEIAVNTQSLDFGSGSDFGSGWGSSDDEGGGGFGLDGVNQKRPNQATGDRYGKFIDQPWKSSSSDPLSTFSIDVDTASYGNVRRMIREGREIPKDAVRIEECINAFNYRYNAPAGEGAFAVGASLAVCPWAPDHQLVRIAIKGREIDANKCPASNLVFLIDVSGSMQSPDKLPLLKQSMATMVQQLDERDRVAIVVYAGSEGVVLPSTRLDAEGKATVLTTLSKLGAGGSTNGGAGIKRAYELAMKEKIEGGVNRVILATDGDFNVGVTGQRALVELVKDRAQNGVYLTVVGFGTGNLNDSMMDAITRDGNGNYFYIDSEREGKKVFLQNLSGTLVTIAKDVKIQVEFNPAKVGSYRLIGYANRVLRNEDFNNDKIDAGDIGAGHSVTAFYELTPPGAATDGLKYQATSGNPVASAEWLTVKLRHKHPDGNDSRKIEFPLTGDALPLEQAGTDFQFATAVAMFGMKLRGMNELGQISWEKVASLARPGLAADANEDRAEFLELLNKLAGNPKPIIPAPAELMLSVFFYNGEYETCIEVAEPMLETLPKNTPEHDICLHVLSGSYFYTGQYEKAQPLLEQHVKSYPKSLFEIAANYFVASNMVRLQFWSKAATLLDAFISAYPDATKNVFLPFALYDRANCHYVEEQYEEALVKIGRVITEFQSSNVIEQTYNLKGNVEQSLKNAEAAEKSYLTALELAEKRKNRSVAGESLFSLVALIGEKKPGKEENPRFPEAVTYADKFWKEYAEGSPYKTRVAVAQVPALASVGRSDEALERLREVIVEMAKNPEAQGLEALINSYTAAYLEKHTLEELKELFFNFKGIAHNDVAARALLQVAVIGVFEGVAKNAEDEAKKRAAKAMIKVLFQNLKTDFVTKDLTNFILVKVGDFLRGTATPREALAYYDEAISRQDQSYRFNALLGRADVYGKSTLPAEIDKGLEDFTRVYTDSQEKPEKEFSLYRIVELHMAKKDYAKAAEQASIYLDRDKTGFTKYSPKVGLLMAKSYEERNQLDDALAMYVKVWSANMGDIQISAPAILSWMKLSWDRNKASADPALPNDRQGAYNGGAQYIQLTSRFKDKMVAEDLELWQEIDKLVQQYEADPAVKSLEELEIITK